MSMSPSVKPIAQKKHKQREEKRIVAQEETNKLLAADFMREVQYPTWLANVVMVKKASGKWRMCTDYTNLNKACPKDPYPLPNIDWLVDGVSGFALLRFMDAYSGYNQIWMHPQDEEKTAFITDVGAFYYKVMPFGLKNAGATYQRLMDKIFKDVIGADVEVYVDDMVVKSATTGEHCAALGRVFGILRKHQLRLNPDKCSFGVQAGKFLGFLLTERGIEANPEKCQAIIGMRSPRSVKKVQQLMGRITALSRFISRSAETTLPIFGTLKKGGSFAWTPECEEAFLQLKALLATYRKKAGEQLPVYFTSKVLHGAEIRYQKIEKAALALVITSHRLHPYFQSHSITVWTDLPIRQVLRKLDLARRVVALSVQLSELDVSFVRRRHIKAQALADFLIELTPPGIPEAEEGEWFLSVNRSSNQARSGAGIILEGPDGVLELDARRLTAKSDSKLVTGQVNGEYQARDPQLIKYWERAKKMTTNFGKYLLLHVLRD
ncbi:Retrovirus-related Pol polyprotein from transposon 17.6, partial [Mucuna pruriens]